MILTREKQNADSFWGIYRLCRYTYIVCHIVWFSSTLPKISGYILKNHKYFSKAHTFFTVVYSVKFYDLSTFINITFLKKFYKLCFDLFDVANIEYKLYFQSISHILATVVCYLFIPLSLASILGHKGCLQNDVSWYVNIYVKKPILRVV